MRKACCAFVFFMLLTPGLFVTVPAEDVPETAYDESEAVSYESTPLIAEVMPPAAALATQPAPSALSVQLATPSQATAKRINGADAHRYAGAPVVLALLCTLLC